MLMLATWSNIDILFLGSKSNEGWIPVLPSPELGKRNGMGCRSSLSRRGYAEETGIAEAMAKVLSKRNILIQI